MSWNNKHLPMKKGGLAALLLVLFPMARSLAVQEAVVLADRVNLRSRPGLNGEVVGQVSRDQRLVIKGESGEWVEVQPPDSVDLWIHADFVSNGMVVANQLNVRAGPNINYAVVGRLARGQRVDVRGKQGEWLRIAPPASCSLWVNRRYLKPLSRAILAPAPTIRRRSQQQRSPVAPALRRREARTAARGYAVVRPLVTTVVAERVEMPRTWRLVPLEGQGRVVWREGIIRRIPFTLGSPTSYKLVERQGDVMVMRCYLWGDSQQLSRYSGRELRVKGREYWLRNHRYPVLVVEALQLSEPTAAAP